MNNRFKSSLILLLLLLNGCAAKPATTSNVSVTPVTYQWQSELTHENESLVKKHMDKWIDEHFDDIASGELVVTVSNTRGHQLYNKLMHSLTEKGIRSQNITLKLAEPEQKNQFKLESSKLIVDPIICPKYAIYDNLRNTSPGCYTENSRWKSMSNPNRAFSFDD
ncbi:TPA: hypothetical protein RQK84_000882 [Vibrio vulnificus]|nr:hypothetical protein [Vibrio vulnificus]HDY8012852.1 hypothetical protein [Vibrio vulnificus]